MFLGVLGFMLSHNLGLLLCAAMTMFLLQWLLGSWVSSGVLGFMLSHNLVLLLCAAMTMLLLQWLLGSWVSSGVFWCLWFHVVS